MIVSGSFIEIWKEQSQTISSLFLDIFVKGLSNTRRISVQEFTLRQTKLERCSQRGLDGQGM
jgi:hypothetical protein